MVNVIPCVITLPEDVPFRVPTVVPITRPVGVSNVWLGLTNVAKYLLVGLLVFE